MAFCVCHPRSTRATAHAKCTTWPHASIAHGASAGAAASPRTRGTGRSAQGGGGRCAPRGVPPRGAAEAGRGISAASNARARAPKRPPPRSRSRWRSRSRPVPSFPFFSFLASVFPSVPREASPVASPDPDPVPHPAGARFSSPGAGASRFVGSPAEILLPAASPRRTSPRWTPPPPSSSNSSTHPHRRHGKHVVSPLTPPHAWPHACVLVHASASVRTHAGASSHTDALSANTERSSAVERHQATSAPPGLSSRRPGDESFATVCKPSAGLSSARGATPSPFAPPPPFPAALRRSRADAPRPAATASP